MATIRQQQLAELHIYSTGEALELTILARPAVSLCRARKESGEGEPEEPTKSVNNEQPGFPSVPTHDFWPLPPQIIIDLCHLSWQTLTVLVEALDRWVFYFIFLKFYSFLKQKGQARY